MRINTAKNNKEQPCFQRHPKLTGVSLIICGLLIGWIGKSSLTWGLANESLAHTVLVMACVMIAVGVVFAFIGAIIILWLKEDKSGADKPS